MREVWGYLISIRATGLFQRFFLMNMLRKHHFNATRAVSRPTYLVVDRFDSGPVHEQITGKSFGGLRKLNVQQGLLPVLHVRRDLVEARKLVERSRGHDGSEIYSRGRRMGEGKS